MYSRGIVSHKGGDGGHAPLPGTAVLGFALPIDASVADSLGSTSNPCTELLAGLFLVATHSEAVEVSPECHPEYDTDTQNLRHVGGEVKNFRHCGKIRCRTVTHGSARLIHLGG